MYIHARATMLASPRNKMSQIRLVGWKRGQSAGSFGIWLSASAMNCLLFFPLRCSRMRSLRNIEIFISRMIWCSSFHSHSLIAYRLLILAMRVDSFLEQFPTENEANGLYLASNLQENLDADVRVMTKLHASCFIGLL